MKHRSTVRETAQQMGCTLKYVYDLLYAGKIAGARKIGKKWLIPQVSIDALLNKRGR